MASQRTRFDVRKNALALALERAAARGQAILDLTTSNPTRAGVPYDERAILEALADPRALAYEPLPFGLPEARAAVASELGVDPARVVLTASTSEAYGYLFKLLCDPGDDVLAPAPSYPLFDHLAQFEAVRLVPFRLAYDGAWHVDLDSVARAIGPRTRAILLVSPNNPTGSYTKRDELARLASFGLPIVSDEVFATYPLLPGDERRATTVLEAGGLTFALGGLSKLAALPQIKVGWIVVGGPEAEAAEALARLELIADSYLSLSTPAQLALPRLLATRHVAGDAIRARTQRNLDHLRAAVVGTAATVLHVEGGWYATLRLPATKPEEAWVTELVERDGVHLHPGAFFDFADEPHAIVSLLTPPATFDRGVALVLARVDEATR